MQPDHPFQQENAELRKRIADLENALQERVPFTSFNNLPGMVYRCSNDRDWTMSFVSYGCLELTGYFPFELQDNQGISYGSLIHAADREQVWHTVQTGVANHEPFRMIYRIHTREDQEKWVFEQGCAVYTNGGEVLCVEGFISDVTERMRTEAALQASEERYRTLVEMSPDGICLYVGNRLMFGNTTALRLLGVTEPEKHRGQSVFAFVHPSYHELVRKRIQELEMTGEAPLIEEEFVRVDGTRMIVEVASRRVEYEGQTAVLVVFRDISARKRSERQLHEALGRFEALIEHTPIVAIQGFDRNGAVTHWNQASTRIYGIAREQALGLEFRALLPATEAAAFTSDFDAVWRTGTASPTREVCVLGKDGSQHWLYSILFPVVVDRETREIFHMQVDITSRVHAEDELSRIRNLLETIIMNLPLAVFLKDAHDLHFMMWNKANERLLGIRETEALGKTDFDLFPKEEAAFFSESDRRTLESGRLLEIPEETVSTRENGMRILHTQKIPIPEGDAPLYLLGISQDITERKMAEVSLRESEQKYHTLFEGFPYALFLETMEGLILDCNSSACAMMGFEHAELVGKTIFDIVPPEVYSRMPDMVSRLTEKPIFVEAVAQRKDGSVFPTEVGAHLVTIGGRELALVHVRDISARKHAELERKRLEEQILQAQKLESMGILAGGIAHDFNNLLTAILGYADLAASELEPGAPGQDHLEKIVETSRRAADLTQQMLAYSGRGKFSIRAIDLSEVTREMAHLLEVSITKRCSLRYNFGNAAAIEADVAQIRQVIMNLIINASEAIGERNGEITLTTGSFYCSHEHLAGTYLNENQKEGWYSFVEVTDTGCGMTEETRARLFDPFFTTKFAGRGLGLAAVLGIVRGHGGAIYVQSQLGTGSTLRVYFPASQQPAKPDSIKERPVAPAPTATGTILIVDDEELVRTLAAKILLRAGFRVVTAEDGLAALEILRQNPAVDGVLLDLTMPRMSGEEAFPEIRRLRPDVPIVLASGYTEQDATSQFHERGLAGFIQKPFIPNQLVEVLKNAITH